MADTLILHWSKNSVLAVTATVVGQQIAVRKVASMTWPEDSTPAQNASAAGHALKSFLAKAGIQEHEAVVCLSRDAAVTRMLDVPLVSDDELTDIVRLQAATRSSQPAEQLLIDYLPQPHQPGRELGSVLAATLNRSTADTIRNTLTAAGLEVAGIGLSSVGLAELAAGAEAVGATEVLVGAILIGSRLEVSLVRNGNIPFLQSAVLSSVSDEALAAEMRRILFSAQQKLGEFNIGRILVFTEKGRQQLFRELQEEFGQQLIVRTLAEIPQIQLSGELPESVPATALICPLGLLQNRTLQTLPGIDFLHPREKKAAPDNKLRRAGFIGAACLTAMIGGLYLFFSHLGSLDDQINGLKSKKQELTQKLKAGEPVLDTNAELEEWLARDVHALHELDQMQQTLPGTAVAYLNEFRFNVALGNKLANFNGKGRAKDRDKVEQIYREFDAIGFNVPSNQIEISRRDPEYPADFTLTLERPVESAAASRNSGTR